MGNVTFIPARRQVGNSGSQEEQKKLRVAAYCRVSTDSDEQETSYEAQITHYTEYIQRNPEWELAGIFADDGISGTNTKNRNEFNRMIEACMAGKIDMIITKSISRFARNTLDCLQYIRQLKDKNIPVYFEKESINTMDTKGEVLLTIMASLAQQESQSLSQNVKMGWQYRFQQGKVQVNHSRFLGYTKDEKGNLVIVPEQAAIVRRIYREYLEGKSQVEIAEGLEADGIKTGAGNSRWNPTTVAKILRNEKYMGDCLLQKTYTTDFLTKKRIRNNGIVPQYYVEDDHEAIIPKSVFLQAQAELVRRGRAGHTGAEGKRRRYSYCHCFSQKVICGECGDLFQRVHWYSRNRTTIVWRCSTRLEHREGVTCRARTVHEDDLQQVVLQAVNQVLTERESFQKTLQENIVRAVAETEKLSPKDIQARLDELQRQLVSRANSRKNYDAIAEEIFRLRDLKEQAQVDCGRQELVLKRMLELQDFIQKHACAITACDDTLVNTLIESITVYPDHFTVTFQSGLRTEVEG